MLTKKQNELLTQTGAGTAMGNILRRYWMPALLSEELPAPDCPPVRVTLLGENLVAFRDSNGEIGLIGEHCPHRGTSLYYGRNEECGLRCIYHGWKFDVSGRLLDTPAEPPEVDFRNKVNHSAYPCKETGGIIYTYMGPKEEIPLFPNYEWTQVPKDHTYVTKSLLECNYLQGIEGECDSAHVSFLHRKIGGEGTLDLYARDGAPRFETETTDYGVILIALRKAGSVQIYVRISNFVMPVFCLISPGGLTSEVDGYEVHMYVPIDDRRTWRYDFGFKRGRPVKESEVHRKKHIGPDFRRFANKENDYMQDREMQRKVNFTGMEDFLNQDACASESMGEIFDRTHEFLGTSDRGVIAVRHFLLKTLESFESSRILPNLIKDPDKNNLHHIESVAVIMPSTEDWRNYPGYLQASK